MQPRNPLRTAIGGQEMMFPHQTKHPFAGHPKSRSIPEAPPHLAMSFAMKGRLVQIPTDLFDQLRIRNHTLGAALVNRCPIPSRGTALRIRGRPWILTQPTGSFNAIRLSGCRRQALAHFRGFLTTKGRRRATSLWSNSTAMLNSPMCCSAIISSSLRGSPSRFFKAVSIPIRACLRQSSNRYVSTPSSRLSVSSGSPRNNRRTASLLRRALPLVRSQWTLLSRSHRSSSLVHRLR
jgi:hypothetical protein